MSALNAWGAIAAALLAVECILFNLIFLALALGLWRGSAWLRENTGSGLKRADQLLRQGQGYVQQGERRVAGPFVRLRGQVAGLRAGWHRLLRG